MFIVVVTPIREFNYRKVSDTSCARRMIQLEIVRGRENPGGRQQGYRGVGVRVLFSNPSYTLTPT